MTYEITPDHRDITWSSFCNAIYKYRKANIGQESEIAIQIHDWICSREEQNFGNPTKLNSRENFKPQGNYIVRCV